MTTLGWNAAHSAGQIARRMRGAIWTRPNATVSRLLRDRGGVTSLEFALVFPIIMVFIMGTLELDRVMFMELQLQQAMVDVSRYGFTGQAQTAAQNSTTCPSPYAPLGAVTSVTYQLNCRLQQDVCPNATAASLASCPFDVAQLQFSVTAYANLDELGSYTGITSGPGLENQVAQYTVTYSVPFATGAIAHQMGGGIPVGGFAIVFNEPYSS